MGLIRPINPTIIPPLPPGVTEVTVTSVDRVTVLRTKMDWQQVLEVIERRFKPE